MKIYSKNGITLIALIITIIILLILAGVTLNFVLGDNSIISKALLAKEKTNLAQENEINKLSDLEKELENYNTSTSRTEPSASSYNTMSANEHFTGEYYFDGKPIYAKTIYIDSLPNATQKSYNNNIENVDAIWFDISKTWIVTSTATSIPFPYMSTIGSQYTIEFNGINKQVFYIRTAYDRSSMKAYITLNYTKTTDQSNGTTIPVTPANP